MSISRPSRMFPNELICSVLCALNSTVYNKPKQISIIMNYAKCKGQALECSVCLEQLGSSSRVLPCQHTFCHACLDDIRRTHKELRCPECRSLVSVPLEELPANIILMRILESMKNIPPVKKSSELQSQSMSLHSLNLVGVSTGGSTEPARSQSFSGPTMYNELATDQNLSHRLDVSLSTTNQPVSFNPMTPVVSHDASSNCIGNAIYESVFDQNLVSIQSDIRESRIQGRPNPGNPFIEMMNSQSSDAIHEVAKKKAVALYSYRKKESRDLSFQKGDIITVHKKIDENWYQGELNGYLGFFPASYVQVQEVAQCKALYNFRMDSQTDKCLTFTKGDVISIMRRLDSNWVEGRLGEETGIFPISFVQMNDAAKRLISNSSSPVPATSDNTSSVVNTPEKSPIVRPSNSVSTSSPTVNRSKSHVNEPANRMSPVTPLMRSNSKPYDDALYVCSFPYTPHKADELKLTKGNIYYVVDKFHDGWYRGRCLVDGKDGVFPGNYLKPLKSGTTAEQTTNHRNSVTLNETGISSAPTLMPRTTTASLKISDSQVGSSVPVSSKFPKDAPNYSAPKIDLKKLKSAVHNGDKIPESKPTPMKRTVPLVKERYRCIAPYPPSSPSELALQTGEIVYVHFKDKEGWYKGTSQRTGLTGLFPASFVEPC